MGRTATIFLRGRNLLDEQIRNSTSFLRSFSPEPGRSIELGVELTF
jgi:iron complex outermembrane receptor protein